VCAPHPHPSSASFKCWGWLARCPLSELSDGKDHTAPCLAKPGGTEDGMAVSSAPTLTEPLLYGDPPSLPSPSPVPALGLAAATAASAPAASAWLSLRSLRLPKPTSDCSTGPHPGSLLPSLHLAPEAATATGAVRRTPTPSPGYFPPPRSRESCAEASGSSRETHHHGSDCCRGSWRWSPSLNGCGGWRLLRAAEARVGSRRMGMRQWGLR
jgi:hypothetical protein